MATVSGGEKSKRDYGVSDEADEYSAEFDVEENIEGEMVVNWIVIRTYWVNKVTRKM